MMDFTKSTDEKTYQSIARFSFTRKFLIFAAVVYFTLLHSFAQVANYTFASSSGSFTNIGGGTIVNAVGSGWDDNSTAGLPIGFSFTYNGTAYTTFGIQANGFIILGSGTPINGYCPNSDVTNNSNLIMANATDLVPVSTSLGEIRYQLQGTSPNQTLTVQWKNVHHYGGVTNDNWTFQIILKQTSNIVQIVFGSHTQTTNAANNTCTDVKTEAGGVGLVGSSSSDFNARKVVNGTNTWASSATAPDVTSAASVCGLRSTLLPATGLTWTWTPPSPPNISSFSPTSGCPGTSVTITGTNFTGATAVTFGGTNAASFVVNSGTQITAVVGSGTKGTIAVTTPSGTGTSGSSFTVGTSTPPSINCPSNISTCVNPVTYTVTGSGACSSTGSQTYNYTGGVQTWTVPSGVSTITVDAAGAQGGTNASYGTGGLGGRVQGTITVTAG